MGFFSNLFKGKPRPGPEDRVPALAPLIQAIASEPRSMWPGFAASLHGYWDLRFDALNVLVERYLMKLPAAQRHAQAEPLVAADPVVRAALHLEEAWEARGGASKVKDRDGFLRNLAAARAAAEPLAGAGRDPTAAMLLIKIGQGLDDDDLSRRAYQHVCQVAPDLYAAHASYSSTISARWGGSHDGQLAHARDLAQRAAPGSLCAGLPILAHYFHVSHCVQFDHDEPAAKAVAARVLGAVQEASARSVDVAGHPVSSATFDLRTRAAVIAWQANDASGFLGHQMQAIGDVFIKNPWNQLTAEPEMWFDLLRKASGMR